MRHRGSAKPRLTPDAIFDEGHKLRQKVILVETHDPHQVALRETSESASNKKIFRGKHHKNVRWTSVSHQIIM